MPSHNTIARPDGLAVASMIIAPALVVASGFYWTGEGEYGVTGGLLLTLSAVFWITAFDGLFALLRTTAPLYVTAGRLVAIYGAVCGAAGFGLRGLFGTLYGVGHRQSLDALAAHPVVANVLFWVGGPAFPVSVAVLGVMLAVKRLLPLWVCGVIVLGGVLFPAARIPRIPWLAHAVDLLLLTGFAAAALILPRRRA